MASRSTTSSKSDLRARRRTRELAATARSFTLEAHLTLPTLTDLLPGRHVEVTTNDVETLAYDTAGHDLARAGVHLTRHSDPEPGWRLDAPAASVQLTNGSRGRTVPVAMVRATTGLTRGETLVQTGRVSAEVRTLVITDPSADASGRASEPLTLVDVTTHVLTGGDEARLTSGRQVTLEGDGHGIEVLRTALLQAGAVPLTADAARALSLTQTLTPAMAAADDKPDKPDKPGKADKPESLGALVRDYLDAQLAAIVLGDLILRSGRPSVHQTRVAVRRARSTLRTFAGVVDSDAAVAFSTELRWYAHLLGEVRDRDVLHDRLRGQIAALDAADVLGPVASHVESTLASERGEHLRTVMTALDSERYAALLATAEQWRTTPPLTARAARPAAKAQKVLRAAENTLDRQLADVLVGQTDLHPARKAAKRLRYAAELSEPVLGKTARKAIKRNKRLQTLLGEHQDSTVSAEFLRRTGAAAGVGEGHNGYTYGLLAAHEKHRALQVRDQLLRALGG